MAEGFGAKRSMVVSRRGPKVGRGLGLGVQALAGPSGQTVVGSVSS